MKRDGAGRNWGAIAHGGVHASVTCSLVLVGLASVRPRLGLYGVQERACDGTRVHVALGSMVHSLLPRLHWWPVSRLSRGLHHGMACNQDVHICTVVIPRTDHCTHARSALLWSHVALVSLKSGRVHGHGDRE